MKIFQLKRIFSIALALITVIAVLCPICFMIIEADHDCTGENCFVCSAINFCGNALKQFGFVLCAVITAAIAAATAIAASENCRESVCSDSLISLKVKLLN